MIGNGSGAELVVATLAEQRLVAIIRAGGAADAVRTGRLLLDAGVRCLEVSLVTPGALDAIAQLADAAPPDGRVGVGTALSASDVAGASSAGAQFVVSPNTDLTVIQASRDRGLASFPGAATPTEALAAVRAGAHAVKIFPASAWNPGALRDVLAALPQLSLIPTGGVSVDAAADWIAAGALAVGMGSGLSRGEPGEVQQRVARLLQELAAAR